MARKSLKAFVRYDGSGDIVPGSLITAKSKPKVGNWKEISATECCDYVAGSALQTITMSFDDIINAPVIDPTDVSQWNTFYNLPTFGTEFTTATVAGNDVILGNPGTIDLKGNIFNSNTNILGFVDEGVVTGIDLTLYGSSSGLFFFASNLSEIVLPEVTGNIPPLAFSLTSITSLSLPKATSIGVPAQFQGTGSIVPSSIRTIDLPLVTDVEGYALANVRYSGTYVVNLPSVITLGDTVGPTHDVVFSNLLEAGVVMTLTIPAALMTADGGSPDADIVYWQTTLGANLTIITV